MKNGDGSVESEELPRSWIMLRFVNFCLGVWLIFAPFVLKYGPPASGNDRIFGGLIAAVALLAMVDAIAEIRWLNVAFGLWMALSSFLLGAPSQALVNTLITGLAVAAFASVGGPSRNTVPRFPMWRRARGL